MSLFNSADSIYSGLSWLLGGLGVFIIAVVILSFVLSVLYYILYGCSHMKALRMAGHAHPWFAWIPFLNLVAFADAIKEGEDIYICNQRISFSLFRFWWVFCIVIAFVPVIGALVSGVLNIICMGTIYTKLYAKFEYTTDEQVFILGYLSAFFNIIAVVKFLLYKNVKQM